VLGTQDKVVPTSSEVTEELRAPFDKVAAYGGAGHDPVTVHSTAVILKD